jgi:hypothetical protein
MLLQALLRAEHTQSLYIMLVGVILPVGTYYALHSIATEMFTAVRSAISILRRRNIIRNNILLV